MIHTRSTFAFRWLLPIAQLVLCIVAVWPLRAIYVLGIRSSIHAYLPRESRAPNPTEDQQLPNLIIEAPTPRQLQAFEALERREWIPMMLNLPSGLIQVPYAILNPAKQEWVPREMEFKTWRVISWPLIGILFWWSAGRGVEALLAARRQLADPRITSTETAVGAVMFAFCAIAAVCLPLYAGGDSEFPYKFWTAGSILWSAMGGTVVAARIAQFQVRRRARRTNLSDVSPA